jgi:L-cysteine/cystine lyase
MDAAAFRSHFPVCRRRAYLNAGASGPVPAEAVIAARAALASQLHEGRGGPHFARRREETAELRAGYARLLDVPVEEIAMTTSTSEGLGKVIAGMGLGAGDELLIAEAEHPGLLGPVYAARERGVSVRTVPLRDIADAVDARTTAVVCSHVHWHTGEVAPAALAEVDIPVILDGAQAAGAIPVDPGAWNSVAYAAPGQKWLCGADSTGFLHIAPAFMERVHSIAPAYLAFEDPYAGDDLRTDAGRLDTPALSREGVAVSLAALRVLEAFGVAALQERAIGLAGQLADALTDRGITVAPRGATTLVAFEVPEPIAFRDRLAERAVVIRDLPGTRYVRASVGAWNDEGDLERLLEAL